MKYEKTDVREEREDDSDENEVYIFDSRQPLFVS